MQRRDSNGRAVLITGASGALGVATSRRFLEQGDRVAAISRTARHADRAVEMIHDRHRRFHIVQGDVTKPESVELLVKQAVASLGSVEVLVHLVGGWTGGRPIHEHSPGSWDRAIDLNLRSAFLCTRAVVPRMRQQEWGRIVLVSAQAARSGRRHQGAYAVAKAGVSVLAETIAEENGDLDVTANVVAPSALDTEGNRESLPAADHASLVPTGDVAEVIAFLASQGAGRLRGAWLPAFGRV
jgi:NAD(P)-dependent dehydrogenase (short-subunit alcohol dehydrogenase family)